jgi:hypothetical protein
VRESEVGKGGVGESEIERDGVRNEVSWLA